MSAGVQLTASSFAPSLSRDFALTQSIHHSHEIFFRVNYKEEEVEGRELKLHRLTADKKLREVSGRRSVKLVPKVTAHLPLSSP